MKIAIIKLSALGDIIHSAFILQFIKAKIPHSQIDWIVEERFAAILEHNPDIDNIRRVNLKALKKDPSQLLKEIQKLRSFAKERYDRVIDLQGLLKSALCARLIGKKIAGFDKDSAREAIASYLYHDTFAIPYDANTIDRYRRLSAEALGISLQKAEVLAKKPYLGYTDADTNAIHSYLSFQKPNIILSIGATWESRIYPKESLLEVARELDANILIPHGSNKEQKRAMWLEQHSPNCHALPKLNLNQLKALISHANLLIGNDTGPSYIAWANNIPAILLFGSTPPSRIYESEIAITLKSSSPINHRKLNREDFSIGEIAPSEVLNHAKSLLGLS